MRLCGRQKVLPLLRSLKAIVSIFLADDFRLALNERHVYQLYIHGIQCHEGGTPSGRKVW